MLETGIKDLDELLFGLLPEEEWQLLEDDKRDLAGVYFNGTLQKHTPFIDLRSLAPDDHRACLTDFLAHLDSPALDAPVNTCTTAHDFAVNRFGELSARKTIIPSLEKVHKKGATELDFMATIFTPMTRLAFCDETLVRELTLSPALRSRIAWSDQRTLPKERASGRRAMYPVRYGMYRIVDAILRRIQEAGAEILTASDITAVEASDGRVRSVTVRSGGREQRIEDVARLIWTTNIPLLGRYLGVDFTGLRNDKPLKTIVVNMVVDRLPEAMGDLYYFFCYDSPFHTFRLTNFANYCRGAARNGGYPISMELLMTEETAAQCDPAKVAVEEYERFGLSPASEVLFAKAEVLDSGFPMPSVNNIHGLRTIRNRIRDMQLDNVQLVGILAEDNLFFQTDVLADAFRKLS
jgi:protoporphyrinogen oxidase